ncbi:MAG: hypothetical protein M1483_03980 [Actinobacteria bacterium]|nr:hypothetical protein [Actinomycetota bacterium]MCL6104780.1 hypothetical protein [Actinomycetota bacterium]
MKPTISANPTAISTPPVVVECLERINMARSTAAAKCLRHTNSKSLAIAGKVLSATWRSCCMEATLSSSVSNPPAMVTSASAIRDNDCPNTRASCKAVSWSANPEFNKP